MPSEGNYICAILDVKVLKPHSSQLKGSSEVSLDSDSDSWNQEEFTNLVVLPQRNTIYSRPKIPTEDVGGLVTVDETLTTSWFGAKGRRFVSADASRSTRQQPVPSPPYHDITPTSQLHFFNMDRLIFK